MSYQLGNAKVWDGAAWVEAEGGGLPATVVATGGTVTDITDSYGGTYRIHTFNSNGT